MRKNNAKERKSLSKQNKKVINNNKQKELLALRYIGPKKKTKGKNIRYPEINNGRGGEGGEAGEGSITALIHRYRN